MSKAQAELLWIALFRGINVGGNRILPMKSLTALMEKIGCESVQTYIQSGNVVFQSANKDPVALEKKISVAVERAHGFAPRVLILSVAQLRRAIEENPFPHATSNHKSLHFFFLSSQCASPNLKGIEECKSRTESFVLKKKVFYLHAPDGVGKSKLAARIDRFLGVETTARNWQTVTKVLEIATSQAD